MISKVWKLIVKIICFIVVVALIYIMRMWILETFTKISCFIIGGIKIIFINLGTIIVEILQPFIDSGTVTVVIALITAIMGYYFNKSLKNREYFLQIRKELAKKQINSYNALEKFLNESLEYINIDSPVNCQIQQKSKLINGYPKVFGERALLEKARKDLMKLCNESFFESSYIDFHLKFLQSYMDNYLMIYDSMNTKYKVPEETIAFFARMDIYEVRGKLKKGINYFYKNTKGKKLYLYWGMIKNWFYLKKIRKKFEEKEFYLFLYWKLWNNKEIKEQEYKRIIDSQKKSLKIIDYFNKLFGKNEIKKEVYVCKECRHSKECKIEIDNIFHLLKHMKKDFNEYEEKLNKQN